MVEVLSEIKILPGNMPVDGPIIGPGIRPEPIMKVLKKKKEPKMLEEQIRDYLPYDIEPEEDKYEEF